MNIQLRVQSTGNKYVSLKKIYLSIFRRFRRFPPTALERIIVTALMDRSRWADPTVAKNAES